jgi:hypothetical protein
MWGTFQEKDRNCGILAQHQDLNGRQGLGVHPQETAVGDSKEQML